MAIVNVSVKKRKFGIAFVPRYVANKLVEPSNIISIEYEENTRPEFVDAKRVLPLISTMIGLRTSDIARDNGVSMDLDDALEVFIESCKGENIIVHCEAGKLRSRHLASRIMALYPQYTMMPSVTHWKADKKEEYFIPRRMSQLLS